MPDQNGRYLGRNDEDAVFLLEHFMEGSEWEIWEFENMGVFRVKSPWQEVKNEKVGLKTNRAEVECVSSGLIVGETCSRGWRGSVYLSALVARPYTGQKGAR